MHQGGVEMNVSPTLDGCLGKMRKKIHARKLSHGHKIHRLGKISGCRTVVRLYNRHLTLTVQYALVRSSEVSTVFVEEDEKDVHLASVGVDARCQRPGPVLRQLRPGP